MSLRRMTAILLMILMLLSCAAWAEAVEAQPAEAVAAEQATPVDVPQEQSAPEATEASGTSAPVEAAETPADQEAAPAEDAAAEKPALYVLAVDCGFAFYGAKEGFKGSSVEYPADQNGYVVECVRSALNQVAAEDAGVLVYGYHSKVLEPKGTDPVSAKDAKALEDMFSAITEGNRGKYYSSSLAPALKAMDPQKWSEYDPTLVLINSGTLNFYNGEVKKGEDIAAVKAELDRLRAAGMRIRDISLSQSSKPELTLNADLFGAGEYCGVPVALDAKDKPMYNDALMKMAAAFIDMLLKDADEGWGRAAAPDDLPDGQRVVALFSDRRIVDGTAAEVREAVKGDKNAMCWTQGGDTVLPSEEQSLEAEQEQDRQRQRANDQKLAESIMGEVARSSAGLSVALGATEVPLPQGLDMERISFVSDNLEALEVSVADGALTLNPKAGGMAVLSCEIAEDEGEPVKSSVEIPVYALQWSWQDAESDIDLIGAGEYTVTAPVGIPQWTLSVAGSEASEVLRAENGAAGEWEGLSWSVQADDAGVALTLTPTRPGAYEIAGELSAVDGQPVSAESGSRRLVFHRPADDMSPVALIYPYFREQDGQRVGVTSGGEAVSADEYDIAVQPEGALEVLTAGDGALYLLPRKAGDASVTLTERGVENPKSAVLQVTVHALMRQPMLWLCAVGAAVCLIGLTAAVVILIGKRAQGSAKER